MSESSIGLKKCYEPTDAQIELDVVLVHGLTGNRERTWTWVGKKSSVFWPQDLLPKDIPSARIWSYGYDANIAHFWDATSQSAIGDHARTLLNKLGQTRRRTRTQGLPIIFVAHSLGGLVLQDMMLASRNSVEAHLTDVHKSVHAIAFLGTPHCGSKLANWGSIFGKFVDLFKKVNTPLVGVLKPDSEVLARIQQDFHTMLRGKRDGGERAPQITCFYEDLPIKGVGEIVPKESAIIYGYNAIAIHNQHTDMGKYASYDDDDYQSVSNELWGWAEMLQASAGQSIPNAPPNPSSSDPGSNSTRQEDEPTSREKIQSQSNVVNQASNSIQDQSLSNVKNVVQGNNINSSSGNVTFNSGG